MSCRGLQGCVAKDSRRAFRGGSGYLSLHGLALLLTPRFVGGTAWGSCWWVVPHFFTILGRSTGCAVNMSPAASPEADEWRLHPGRRKLVIRRKSQESMAKITVLVSITSKYWPRLC